MHLDFDDYPPYSDALSDFFDTKTSFNLRCCPGCPNSSESYTNNTWVIKNTW